MYHPKLARPKPKKIPVTPADCIEIAIEGDTERMNDFLNTYPELLNMKDERGNVALHVASSKGLRGMTELLIRKGGDINIQDIFGNTPLLYAIDKEEKEIVELLILRGARIQLCDFRGNSPLHSAAAINNLPMVEFLLAQGADPEAYDFGHQTPKQRTGTYAIVQAIERELANRKDGGESATQKLLNYMGFGIGLGVGMGMALAKQQEMYAKQLRDEEDKKKESILKKKEEMNARLKGASKKVAKTRERQLL